MQSELYQQGIARAAAKDFAGAIAAFDDVLRLFPDFTEAYYNRGLAYFNLGKVEAAIANYSSALQLDPTHASLHYARSLGYLSAGNIAAAIADAKQAILLRSDYAAAYYLLGTARQRQGEPEKAIASYKKAAELYLDQKDGINGRRCLDAIQALHPPASSDRQSNPDPIPLVDTAEFLQQAVEKAKHGNPQGAMEDLDWALELDPQDAQAYFLRGQVRAELDDRHGAIDDYKQAATVFLNRADREMAQRSLDAIDRLKTTQPRVSKVVDFQARRTASSYATPTTGRLSAKVRHKLLRLVGNDRKIVANLVENLKIKHPSLSEDWYWEKAIYDLERDRR